MTGTTVHENLERGPDITDGTDSTDWLVSASLAPNRDDVQLEPFYAAAARGVLVLPFCTQCGTPLEFEQRVCDRCDTGRPAWLPSRPTGVIHAATVVHRLEPGLIRSGAPYPVLDVELASGHRLLMTTTAPPDVVPVIGDAVTIGFRCVGGVAIPAVDVDLHPVSDSAAAGATSAHPVSDIPSALEVDS